MERFRNPPPKSHWQRCLLKVHGLQHVVFDEAWCCLGIVGPPSDQLLRRKDWKTVPWWDMLPAHITYLYQYRDIYIYIYITYAISKSCYDICIQHDVYRHVQLLQVWAKIVSWHLLEASTRHPSRAGISTEVSLTFVDVAARWHGVPEVHFVRKTCVYIYIYYILYIYIHMFEAS